VIVATSNCKQSAATRSDVLAIWRLLDAKTPHLGWIAIVLGLAVCHAAMYGPQASFLTELFGTKVRYSGVSLGYNLASIFAGALSPLIATGLMTAYRPEP
jgi:MFS transporter, MHS family, shikimate and dehydroshikimate transport protein